MNIRNELSAGTGRSGIICTVALALAYVFFAASLTNAPLLDFPNHLARAGVLGDLIFDAGKTFGQDFSWKPELAPYLAPDLLLAWMLRVLGVKATTGLWIAAAVLAQPLAVIYLLRTNRCSPNATALGALISLVLATDWFFTSGFINYRLSISIAIVGFAFFIRFMRSPSIRMYLLFVLAVTMAYLFHLSAYIMLGVAVAASLAYDLFTRKMRWGSALACCAPLAIVGAIHVALTLAHSSGTTSTTNWGGISRKIVRLASSVLRFDTVVDLLIILMLAAPILWIAITNKVQTSARYEARRYLLLAMAFFLVYVALPIETGGVYDVDNRALPYVLTFLLVAFLIAYDATVSGKRVLILLVAAGAAINLCVVAIHMWPKNEFLGGYRALARQVPRGAVVLPIATLPDVGRYQAVGHAGSFVTLDAGNVTPYLFAGDLHPNISYFTYRDRRPYAPSMFWYDRNDDQVDWDRVASTYQYILVTKPFDPARLASHLTIVNENSSAALLKVSK